MSYLFLSNNGDVISIIKFINKNVNLINIIDIYFFYLYVKFLLLFSSQLCNLETKIHSKEKYKEK